MIWGYPMISETQNRSFRSHVFTADHVLLETSYHPNEWPIWEVEGNQNQRMWTWITHNPFSLLITPPKIIDPVYRDYQFVCLNPIGSSQSSSASFVKLWHRRCGRRAAKAWRKRPLTDWNPLKHQGGAEGQWSWAANLSSFVGLLTYHLKVPVWDGTADYWCTFNY